MIKNIAQHQIELLVLIIIIQSLLLNNPYLLLSVLGLMILRNEVIRPFFYKEDSTSHDKTIEDLKVQLDTIQREISTIKLDKAIRSFN